MLTCEKGEPMDEYWMNRIVVIYNSIKFTSFNVKYPEWEVKKVINKQVLMVFFFPIGIAVIHTVFAFKLISKLLGLFGLFDTNVFLISIIITTIVFIVLYAIVYIITSNVYYKIVQQE